VLFQLVRIRLLPLLVALSFAFAALAQDDAPQPPSPPVTIHVSSSAGVDGQDGLTPETAVKTIRRGQALLRNGQGDRLLLKRGDTFAEVFGNWNKSGKSPDEPLVIGAYGEGPRPIVTAAQTIFNIYGKQPLLHDVTISGIHFVAAGRVPGAVDYDPAYQGSGCIRVVRLVHRLTVDDCRFDCFTDAIVVTGEPNRPLLDVAIRRCVVVDSYCTSAAAHSGQGLYADKVDGLTVEGCVFDHNGWSEQVAGANPNLYRHNLYISHETSGVRVRGNVIARGASHGMQMRGGGVCEGNLFIDNAIHAFMAGEESVFRGNVVIGGRDIDAKNPRGMGLMIAAGKGLVEDNLFVHKPSTSGAAILVEVGKWSPPSGVSAEIRDNIIYDWQGNAIEITQPTQSLVIRGNDVQHVPAGKKVITIKKPAASVTVSGNRYDAAAARDKWFSLPQGFVIPADWATKTGDDSRAETVRYPGADRRLPDDFLAGAREQRPGYTAANAIARLREAFGKKSDSARAGVGEK
jgi:parallel beta helix pectate lyase-like protein